MILARTVILGRTVAAVAALAISAVTLLGAGVALAAPAPGSTQTAGYDGPCTSADSNGVTVVIDFQELDGNDARPAPTLVRCSPVAGNSAALKRTGLQALVDAGIVVSGTARWGDSYPNAVPFLCRVQGRPAVDEPLALTASGTTYVEGCGDTPPGDAYWAYWHSDGQGGDWTYSNLGVMNRFVVPGGYEGWSFSLNVASDQSPKPRVSPVNPSNALRLSADATEVAAGHSVALTWNAVGATSVVVSGAWNGTRLATGSETITLAVPGSYRFAIRTLGLDPEQEREVTVTVTGDGSTPDDPASGGAGGADPAGTAQNTSAATLARQSAGWLVGELAPAGQMAGPSGGTDWGLTIDTLWALHGAGTGATASRQIIAQVASHAGEYLGPDLFANKDARLGGSAAKLLVAAVVAGKDPAAFGTGRFLPAGTTYDLRAETLGLLQSSGAQQGRIINRATGNDETNIFAQALAVIGLARSGGVPASAVHFLSTQQCAAGFFRMYYADQQTCDAARGVADTDGTAMAVQALIAARDVAGVDGLDAKIDRALTWLRTVQKTNGSFGGGVGVETSNANSTGLVAQAVAAAGTGGSAANARVLSQARSWITSVHAHRATASGSQLASAQEYGAIAYDRAAFRTALAQGISAAGRDQWRRATAQAIFALAPVSFADLGTTEISGDPVIQNHPAPVVADAGGGGAAPPPGSGVGQVVTATSVPTSTSGTTATRLGRYLSAHLVDGNHVEVTVDGTTYVDYDATAQMAFALIALPEQRQRLNAVATFLLHPKSVAAFAHGAPYDDADAAYAAPLAQLVLIARAARLGGAAGVSERRVRQLDQALRGLTSGVGKYADRGRYGDGGSSTARSAWIALALTAAGDGGGDAEGAGVVDAVIERIVAGQCADGTFPVTLGGPADGPGDGPADGPGDGAPESTACATGDLAVTALAVQALNAVALTSASTQPGETAATRLIGEAVGGEALDQAPAAWPAARRDAIAKATQAAVSRTARNGLALSTPNDLAVAGSLAAVRAGAGLDLSDLARSLGQVQRGDGGFAPHLEGATSRTAQIAVSMVLAPGAAGRSWVSSDLSPLVRAVQYPRLAPAPEVARPASDGNRRWWLLGAALIALGAAVGAAGAGIAGGRRHRFVSHPEVREN